MNAPLLSPIPLTSRRCPPLKGRLRVPGDKSISHRALMLGAAAIGNTRVRGLLEADDVINTAKAMSALGAKVEKTGSGEWQIGGTGIGNFVSPETPLDFGNSGTGVRLALGLMATTPLVAQCVGDASLSKRPMARVIKPLELFGAKFDATDGGKLPLVIHGARHAVPVEYVLPVASAQVKSAVLFAGLNAPGCTTVIEPVKTRDHSERMLKAFGARIEIIEKQSGREISIEGQHELKALSIDVPGDPSSAAFPMVAALICEGSDIVIENIMLNPTRTGLVDTLIEMGADITVENRRTGGGEDVGDLRVRHSQLKGVRVPPDRAPSMIDEFPVLSIAASFAEGTTRMEGLDELRVKESDRLAAVEAGLRANGVDARSGKDWLEVTGSKAPGGGTVVTHMDHRIAMSFLVMGMASKSPVTIDDSRFIMTSFPGFADLMNSLGGAIA